MQTLAFDGSTGASGDMILAALLAVGADSDALTPVETALPVEYRIGETTKNGIVATTVDVLLEGTDGDEPTAADDHEHGHTHEHEHAHAHDHAHEHHHAEGAGTSRTYAECCDLVAEMGLPESVEADALAIFERLGEAESRVHGTDLDSTYFHEVGADDAIADIVGVALLLDDLGVERVATTPVSAGGGEASMSHGTYPVPTPAVTYIAETASWTLCGGPIETELLTPTGAAILAHVADGVESLPPLSIDAVGYGAGDKSFADYPNVLRATLGESTGELLRDGIRVLETTVDDVTPEILGGLHERLAEAGARDVSIVPTTMKKSRPGHLIQVIVRPRDVTAVARKLATETGTLGVRETPATHRWIADRTIDAVDVEIDGETHEVHVKVASDDDGTVYDASAEYDDCAAIAAETGVPTRDIARRAETTYRNAN
ncbi:nickel pincer cofactor biosynthesis protein LarC [Natronomonas sp.]|uniref:nickel pincer cofactor biosynthesis protein LarC n=1 Tax=Natronomonas sp. TaxID=2184060 RepID=UPI0039753C4E